MLGCAQPTHRCDDAMTTAAADIFRQAAAAMRDHPLRQGHVLHLPPDRPAILTGDLHGDRANLAAILSHALARPDAPMLLLQEVLHGPVDPRSGVDRSCEVLLRAARTCLQHPDRAVMVMGNHDLAQVTGAEILKHGAGVCKLFAQGVAHCFGEDSAADVLDAVAELCLSLPIGCRFGERYWFSHTLPAPGEQPAELHALLTRPIGDDDLHRGGALYRWLWGPEPDEATLAHWAETLGVDAFVLGHTHLDGQGARALHEQGLLLNSDGPGGCICQFRPGQPLRKSIQRVRSMNA
jgi:3',5'-cyclic AMP phosphodiesterase CpdA